MKKLTLLFSMLIASTVLFAQGANTGEIKQNSNDNLAKITQAGSTNNALVMQAGSGNHEALVDQSADGNTVTEINQAGSDNYSTVTQKGSGANWVNVVTQSSDDNSVIIDQDGAQNYVGKLTQYGGNENEIEIDQIGTNNRVEKRDNRAVMQQGKKDEFRVWQNGNDNLVRLVDQEQGDQGKYGGGYNDFIVVQGDGTTQSYRSYVEGDQVGYDNNTYIEQFGTEQKTSFYQYGQNNDLDIRQSGHGNTALYNMPSVGSDGISWEDASVQNDVSDIDAKINQMGEVNTAMMTVKKDDNKLNVYQDGNTNNADIAIDGSGNGRDSHEWVGNFFYGHWSTTERAVNITQVGNGNTGHIDITGNDNSAVIVQGTASAMGL